VYDFKIRYAQYEGLIDVLLRSYSGVFDGYTNFQEAQIAKRLHKDPEMIVKMLQTLKKSRILDYVPQTIDPLITLLETRVMKPTVNMKQLDELKKRRLQSLEALQQYARQEHCRSAFWIRYFTEVETANCGSCDVCKRNAVSLNNDSIEADILQQLRIGARDFHTFSHSFPLEIRTRYLQVLESLIDTGKVLKTTNNELLLQP
jgi:ATP-dependent DNA helicase RecQ